MSELNPLAVWWHRHLKKTEYASCACCALVFFCDDVLMRDTPHQRSKRPNKIAHVSVLL